MCIAPIMVKNNDFVEFRKYSHHAVPCGKCFECRMSRGAGWAFRLNEESKLHARCSFVTLTYSDEYIPTTVDGLLTLNKSHLQKYFKILRKRSFETMKYYACGEYGTNTKRPHYHVILFGRLPDDITKSWAFGHVRVDPVNMATISYVCGYVNKPAHKFNDGRVPEFSLMSKGLGASYLTPEMVAYHQANLASFVTLPGGVKNALPRYFRDKIFTEDQRKVLAGIAEAQHELDIVRYELKVGYPACEHNRAQAVKSAVKRQSLNLKKRNTI